MFRRIEMKKLDNETLVEIYQNTDSAREKEDAISALVENNMGLITSVLKGYQSNYRVRWDDLVEAGRCGIFFAAQKYDKTRGTQFHTYAVSQIRSQVSDEINKSVSGGTSNHYATNIREVRRAISAIKNTKGDDYSPDAYEIYNYIRGTRNKEVSVSTIYSCMKGIVQADYISIDDEEANIVLPDTDEDNDAQAYAYQESLKQDIDLALSFLKPEERFVFKKRIGYPDNETYTFDQIATMMNKNPLFVKNNKNKAISAFIAEKLFMKAKDELAKNVTLSRYQEKNNDLSKIVQDCEITIAPNVELAISASNEMFEDISDSFIPDFVPNYASADVQFSD